MADDIDDLLDEVENKFINKPFNSTSSEINLGASHGRGHLFTENKELLDLINDIPEHLEETNPSQFSKNRSLATEREVKKCFVLYVGGSDLSFGMSTSMSLRPCENLRCTVCDFNVVVFRNFMWDKSTDYIFLRNNMPDFERLKLKLLSRRGFSAYSCQCQHASVNTLTEVKKLEQRKWVCGGHDYR